MGRQQRQWWLPLAEVECGFHFQFCIFIIWSILWVFFFIAKPRAKGLKNIHTICTICLPKEAKTTMMPYAVLGILKWAVEALRAPRQGCSLIFYGSHQQCLLCLFFCLGGTGNGLKTKLNSFYLFYSKRKSVNALFPWFSPCKQAPKLSKIYTNLPTFSADQFAYSFFFWF